MLHHPRARSSSLLATSTALCLALGAVFTVAVGCASTEKGGGNVEPSFVDDDASASPDGGFDQADSDAGNKTESPIGSPLCHVTKATCYPDGPIGSNGAARGGFACESDADAGDGASFACRVVPGSQATPGVGCEAAGEGGDGATCRTGTDCAAGFDCVGDPGRCRRYCCSGACDSSGGKSFCDITPQAGTLLPIPVCTPVRGCELLKDSCGMGESCAVVGDGVTSCTKIGTAQAGQSCDEEHCAENLSCLGNVGSRKCYKLCALAAPASCGAGLTCKAFGLVKDPTVGICAAK